MSITIQWKRLRPGATLPRYATAQAAGMDLAAALDEPLTIEPGAIVMIPCGFAMALPPGYEAQIRPRSGLGSKHGITLPNAPGTIDADYRGEVCVPLINLGSRPFTVEPAMRIAQMIIAPVLHATIIECTDLNETHRGTAGFGSTGS